MMAVTNVSFSTHASSYLLLKRQLPEPELPLRPTQANGIKSYQYSFSQRGRRGGGELSNTTAVIQTILILCVVNTQTCYANGVTFLPTASENCSFAECVI